MIDDKLNQLLAKAKAEAAKLGADDPVNGYQLLAFLLNLKPEELSEPVEIRPDQYGPSFALFLGSSGCVVSG